MAGTRMTYGDGDPIPHGLWSKALANAICGKRGQALLRELEQALLALPRERLISGVLCQDGDVCAMGALALYRGRDVRAESDDAYDGGGDDPMSLEASAEYGHVTLGLRWTLAWSLGEINDEDYRTATPEQRYERVLAWVREQIHQEAPDAPR